MVVPGNRLALVLGPRASTFGGKSEVPWNRSGNPRDFPSRGNELRLLRRDGRVPQIPHLAEAQGRQKDASMADAVAGFPAASTSDRFGAFRTIGDRPE